MTRLNRVNYLILLTVILFCSAGSLQAYIDDPEYHHLDEIWEEIFALQEEYPQWVRVDSIGHSQAENLPIYAVRITTDVHEPPGEKPPVIFVGQVHAEEVLGVEFCMWLMQKMVTMEFNPRQWRDEVDTYIIPTANPEGLNVVYETDYSYRKNKRDNIGDGLFRWFPGWGSDTSGVDINRNFPMHWANGDGFLVKGSNELYDYYRGPAPASEVETQALIAFYDKIRPFYALTIHSSRTGNVEEQVIYPWKFDRGLINDTLQYKFPPDKDVYDHLAREVANRCAKYGQPSVTYRTVRVGHARGDMDTYMYWAFGTYAMRIEIGSKGEAMQPDSAGIYQVINDTRLGFEYILNSASAEIQSDAKGDINWSRFDIYVTDEFGNPTEARIALKNWITLTIPYRTTNPITGRYFWLANSGNGDSLIVSKFGYKTYVRQVNAGSSPLRVGGRSGIQLEPLNWYDVNLDILDQNGLSIRESVDLTVEHKDSTWTTTVSTGQHNLHVPEGDYRLTLYAGKKYVPRVFTLSVDQFTSGQEVVLSSARVLLDQAFDSGRITYTSDNSINLRGNGVDSVARWELTDDIYHSPPRCLTDSRYGNVLLEDEGWCSPYNSAETSFDLSSDSTAALVYWLNQALEPAFDSMWVEAWVPDSGWVQVAPAHQELRILENVKIREWNAPPVNYQQYHPWERVIIPLDEWCGSQSSEFHFRFRLSSDLSISTDGVYIDDVQLFSSTIAPPAISSLPIVPLNFTLGAPYPNPFNGQLSVIATLPGESPIEATLYDIQGRIALSKPLGVREAGVHELTIDAGQLPNGLYLMKVSTQNHSAIRKVMLLK